MIRRVVAMLLLLSWRIQAGVKPCTTHRTGSIRKPPSREALGLPSNQFSWFGSALLSSPALPACECIHQYPRAPKYGPTKLGLRPYFWWIMTAAFHFSFPNVFATPYFGGIPKHMWIWSPPRRRAMIQHKKKSIAAELKNLRPIGESRITSETATDKHWCVA